MYRYLMNVDKWTSNFLMTEQSLTIYVTEDYKGLL